MKRNYFLSFWNSVNKQVFIQAKFLLAIIGIFLGASQLTAQECPDYGENIILVEDDLQNSFFSPQIQVLGNNIFISGSYGTSTSRVFQLRKVEKYGNVTTVFSSMPVSPAAETSGGSCRTTIGARVLSNANILIYWFSGSSSCGIQDAYFKILSPSGEEVKETQKINTFSDANRLVRFVQVEQLSNQNIAFVYATSGQNYSLRRITEDGTFVDNQEISITGLLGLDGQSQYTHKIVSNGKGRFLIFMDYYSIRYKAAIFDDNGTAPIIIKDIQAGLSSLQHVDKRPFATAFPNGNFLLTYQVQNGSGTQTRAPAIQILGPDGSSVKAEQRFPEYYSWGGVNDPVLTKDGFLLDYWYNDLVQENSPQLGLVQYLTKFDFNGSKVVDLNPNCLPTPVDEFARFGYFTDIDGDLALSIRDKPEASASSFDFSLIRRDFGPVPLIDSVQILTNTTAKISVTLGDPGDLVVSEKGLIFIDTLISQNPLLETTGVGKVVNGSVASGNFEGTLTDLSPDKIYAVKAYAKTTDDQVFYSKPIFFSTNTAPSFNHDLTDGTLSLSVAENTTAVLDILASDPDAGQTLSFTLSGTDAVFFEVDQATRKLSFIASPDFETPLDQNKDNVYELTVIATDNGAAPKSTELPIRVSVTNVAEIAFIGNRPATEIGATGAKLIGEIVHNGGGGNVTASGFVLSVTSTNATPVLNGTGVTDYPIGTTLGELSKLLTGLQENTSYSFRTYAINASGTAYAEVGTFTTFALAQSPPVISYEDSNLNQNKTLTPILPTALGSAVPSQVYAEVSTVTTNVSGPRGMVMDAFGNLYVAEAAGKRISKIAPDGTKTVIAQYGSFEPVDITLDTKTGDLYVVILTHRVLWIPNTNKTKYPTEQPTHVWTNDGTNVFAGTSNSGTTDGVAGTSARFNIPLGITISLDNTYLLVAEYNSHRIRKIDIATKMVTTFTGSTTSGTANGDRLTQARFQNPEGVFIGPDGSVYVTEINSTNHRVRKITGDEVSTLSGSGSGLVEGPGITAKFNEPRGVTADPAGNVYVVEGANHVVRQIASDGKTGILVGSPSSRSGNVDGLAYSARFNKPTRIYYAPDGFLYVGDTDGNRIRKVSLAGYELTGTLPQGMSFDRTKGEFSGKPTQLSLKPYYVSDFEESISYQAVEGTITPTLVDNADQLGSLIRLTPSSNSQRGGMTIPASGRKDRELQVDFDLVTGKASGGADGISYSFASDADASTTTPRAEIGSGSGLSLSFNTYVGGIRLYYGANKAQTNTVGQSGLLAYSNSTSWRGKSVQVSMSIIRDSVSVYVDQTLVFDRVPLPAGYKTADLSTWKHVIKSRTGGINDIHAIDRLSISQGYGQSSVQVAARNIRGKYAGTLKFTVGDLPIVKTSAVSDVKYDGATSGLVVNFDGNLPLIKKGLIWGTSAGLTLGNALGITEDSSNQDTLVSQITGLSDQTTYYVRAYAENALGIGYGTELTFETPPTPPSVAYDNTRIILIKDQSASVSVSNSGGEVPSGFSGMVSTLAGSTKGFSDGQGAIAKFDVPYGIVVDGFGNVYVADFKNDKIRKIDSSGNVTTLAGSTTGFANDVGINAQFKGPQGVALDAAGNMYVADQSNHKIRKIDSSGNVTTLAGSDQGFADGAGASAKFFNPAGVAVDGSGNVYVADQQNNRIRKITQAGVVSTLAGSTAGFADGVGAAAKFYNPTGVAVDAEGNVYVAGQADQKIRKIDSSGNVTTLAGSTFGFADGAGADAMFQMPTGVAVDGSGNVYVADRNNFRIRKIDSSGNVTTFAGSSWGFADGEATVARFKSPTGVTVDAAGNVYVADISDHRIRKITNTGWSISPALPAGLVLNTDGSITGTPTELSPEKEYTLTAVNAGGTDTFTFKLGVAEIGLSNLSVSEGELSPEFASDKTSYTVNLVANVRAVNFTATAIFEDIDIQWKQGDGSFASISSGTASPSISIEEGDNLVTIEVSEGGKSISYTVNFKKPTTPPAITYVPSVTLTLNVPAESLEPSNTGGVVPSGFPGTVSTFAGSTSGFANGQGTEALFYFPHGVTVDASGNVYVADEYNHRIRKITPAGVVSTFAGSEKGYQDGQGTAAKFSLPAGVAVDGSGNVYVADKENYRIRKITPERVVSTLAGSSVGSLDGQGTVAGFNKVNGVTADEVGNVYVADQYNSRIRKITPAGVVSTLAGVNSWGSADGLGTAARFSRPQGVAVDAVGNVYVADMQNHLIRKITPVGEVSTLWGDLCG